MTPEAAGAPRRKHLFGSRRERDDAHALRAAALRDCLRSVGGGGLGGVVGLRGPYSPTGRDHKRTLSLSGGNEGAVVGWGGLLLGRPSRGESELARKKATGAVVWNMFDIGHNGRSVFAMLK